MATFKKNEDISVSTNIDVDVEISVSDFYHEMSETENEEMAKLMIGNLELDIMDLMPFLENEDKPKFYKDLAYYVGVSDTQNLELLIEELKYWKR